MSLIFLAISANELCAGSMSIDLLRVASAANDVPVVVPNSNLTLLKVALVAASPKLLLVSALPLVANDCACDNCVTFSA